MKKLLFLLFLISPLFTNAQTGGLALMYWPQDNGLGIRVDKRFFFPNNGMYATVAYGNYKLDNGVVIKNHVRSSIGYTKYIKSIGHSDIFYNTFSAGVNFHAYGKYTHLFIEVPNRTFFPVSLEFGAGAKINNFNCGILFDPIKWEGGIYIGFWFNC